MLAYAALALIFATAVPQVALPKAHFHTKHTRWFKYTNNEYGFSFWYPSIYKPIRDEERCQDNDFRRCLLWLQKGDDSENPIVVTIITAQPFHGFPNHGDVMPSKRKIDKHVFFCGMNGSMAVGFSYECIFNLRNRTLEFNLAEAEPLGDTNPLDPGIPESFRVTGTTRPKSRPVRLLSNVSASDTPDRILVRGCLSHVLDQFHFASGDLDSWVVLTGNTAGLERYVDQELILEGSKGEPVRIEGYFEPIPSFEVTKVVRVFEEAEPELARDFTDKTAWRTVTSRKYGVRFAHPESMTPSTGPTPTESIPSSREGVETVASFEIPRSAYANANLSRGSFTILVNRAEKTRSNCMRFAKASSGDEGPSFYSVGNLRYLKTTNPDGTGGMGSWPIWNNFHIFRNGLCYEISFELLEYSARSVDTGCNTPLLSPEDNWSLIKSLLNRVSFFRPVVHSSAKPSAVR